MMSKLKEDTPFNNPAEKCMYPRKPLVMTSANHVYTCPYGAIKKGVKTEYLPVLAALTRHPSRLVVINVNVTVIKYSMNLFVDKMGRPIPAPATPAAAPSTSPQHPVYL